ncbi:MAG: HAD family hydrolase [Phycisphaerales bacterium]
MRDYAPSSTDDAAPASPAARAVIFDFDGTLVDSEPLHGRALRSVFEPIGLEPFFDEAMCVGLPDADVMRAVFTRGGRTLGEAELAALLETKSAAARRLWESGEGRAYPGAIELLREVKRRGTKVAVCTAALRREAGPVLERLGVAPILDAFVTADDVTASKPNPACYRLACERLGLPPSACVAIEDSVAGVTSAATAGCRVVALGHTTARERLTRSSWFVDAISAVDAAWLVGT